MRHRRLPRAVDHRLPARGPRAQAAVRRRQRGRPRPARRAHRALRRRRRLRRRRPRPVQRRRGVRRRRGARHLPQAPAAELRRVRRGPLLHAGQRDRPAGAVRHRRRQGRRQHLRGHLEPRRPARRCRPPAAPSWPSTSTPRRTTAARRRTASGCWPPGPPTPTRRSCTSTRSAARTSWSSTAARSRSTPRARCSPAARSSSRTCSIVDVPIAAVYRQRLLDPRGRDVAGAAADDRSSSARRAARTPSRSPTRSATPLDPIAELYEALVLGTRDYCAQERLHRRRDRPVRRHRLDARRGHRRRRPRRRPRARRVDAVAVLVATTPSPTPPCSPPTSASTTARSRSSRRSPPTSRCSAPSFEGRPPGLTQENLQSRCRGQVLMALSNEFGWMVLTTGNKSEMAVGYFTIYGDSVGGYAVIKDVLKTEVYDLCRYVNERAGREIDPRERDHQAAVGRAAPRPARRPEPAALRGARPDPRRCTSRRTARPARSSSSATTRPSCAG